MSKIDHFDIDLSKVKFKRATSKQIDFLNRLGIRAYLKEQFPKDPEEMYQKICDSRSSASFYISELLRLEQEFEERLREQRDLPENHHEGIPIITELLD